MSFRPYPSYQDSGIEWLGAVPRHWTVERLGNLYREVSEAGSPELPVLSVSIHTGVSDEEAAPEDTERKIVRSEDRSKYKRVSPNDLTYNMMRAWQGGFGTVQVEGMVSPAYVVARPRTEVPSRYIELLLRTPGAVEEMRRHSRGVTDFRLRLYWDQFKDLRVALPPKEERDAILAFLEREADKIDALVEQQRRLIQLLREKRQAVISHAVMRGLDPTAPMKDSGVEWLGEVPAHWSVAPLRYVARVQTGVAKGKDLEGHIARTVPYLRVANVQDGHIDLTDVAEIKIAEQDLSRYLLRRGDVLMNEGGDFDKLGRGDIWQGQIDPCIHQNHVFAVRPTGVSAEWLNLITSSSYAQQYFMTRSKQSTNLASISSRNVMNLPVVLPPPSEQASLAARVGGIILTLAEMRETAEGAVKLLQERRAALISAAVTGKIDVRGAAIQRAEAA